MSVGNNGSRLIGNTEFYGGLSTDNKIGIENSYADGECLDVRKSPSQMTVLPMARTLPDGGVITGLMTAMTQSKDGNIWGIDEDGKVYKIDENNAITAVSTAATSSGFSLESSDIDDGLWWADGGHKLFSYGRVLNPTGAARATNSFEFLEDHSEYIDYAVEIQQNGDQIFYQSDPDIKRSAGTQNVAIKTSVSEAEADKILFLPALIPLAKIGVRFTAKGSGTVRLEIHDENNNVLASSSEKSASDVSTDGYTEFEVRPNPSASLSPINQFTVTPWAGDTSEGGDVLHIHIVASSSGYTVKSSVADSLWLTGDITSTAYVLHETFNRKHPMVMYDKLYIGNGRYVSTKESTPLNFISDTLFIQDALRLDDGFEVCSFGSSDEYLMIGAEKYSAGSTRGFQAGRIYFWDRQSEGPNFYIDCNMGSPKCIFNFGNIVYIIIAGALYAYTGGKELVKVRTLKGTDTEYSGRSSVTEVYPNMMTIRREVLMIGFPSHTTAYSIRHGIYAFGSVDKNYPNCFTYNYKIPGATTSETLDQHNSDEQEFTIGCVYNFNDTLFYSYKVKNNYTGKNILPTPYNNTSQGGVSFTANPDGTITLNGANSGSSSAYFITKNDMIALPAGTYYSIIPDNPKLELIIKDNNGNYYNLNSGNGCKLALANDITIENIYVQVAPSFTGTFDNYTFYPMLTTEENPTVASYEPPSGGVPTSDTRVALAVVDNDSGTSTSFMWKSLQYDAGSPAFQKEGLRVGIYFDPLPENTTITPMFRLDDGEWELGPATATTGDRYITCEVNKRFHELQYGFVGTTGNDLLTPVIKQVSAEIRVLNEEAKL